MLRISWIELSFPFGPFYSSSVAFSQVRMRTWWSKVDQCVHFYTILVMNYWSSDHNVIQCCVLLTRSTQIRPEKLEKTDVFCTFWSREENETDGLFIPVFLLVTHSLANLRIFLCKCLTYFLLNILFLQKWISEIRSHRVVRPVSRFFFL